MIDKKKLKEEYKNIVHPKGIFIIKKNGIVYLGGALNLHGILDKNKFMLNLGSHKCTALQEDWNKYGETAFEFEIAEQLELKDNPNYNYDKELQILEMMWIDKYRPFDINCYNRNENIRTV
jgi:hypothetical protein